MRTPRSEAERYLRQVPSLRQTIASARAELNDLCTVAGGMRGIAYDGVRVQTSHTTSPLEDDVIRRAERMEDLNALIRRKEKELSTIIDAVREMPEDEHKRMLLLLFIDQPQLSWQQIVDKMHYSEDHCWKLRKNALDLFAGVMDAQQLNQ